MGRPLARRYFGNENTGDSGTNASDYTGTAGSGQGIGGDSVDSVTITAAGTYTSALPTVSFSNPNLLGVGGVQATGTVHGKALSAVVAAAGSGYNLADVLTQTTGGTGTMGTWNVNGLAAVSITLNNGGSANDVGDEFTFAIAGFATPIRVRVTASNAGVATAVSIVPNDGISGASGGIWTAGALPGNTIGMTRTQVAAGSDFNGTGLEVNFVAWGVATVGLTTEGDYTAISSGAQSTSVTPAGGTGATLTITYGVKSVEITDPGSGYTTVADAAPTFSTGAATGTSVLTVDTGTPYTRDAFNTLVVYAQTTSGGSNLIGDILKQENTQRYKVQTADGVAYCNLVAGTPNEAGEMSLKATDDDGGTYYVIKLTAHLATLIPNTGILFEANSRAHWTLSSSDASYDSETTVIVENA
jgi:hypothetical protein